MNMRFIRNVPGIPPLIEELAEYADLWNFYNFRTKGYGDSPHRDVSDIWLRYRDWSELNMDAMRDFGNTPTADYTHWYATAHLMPSIKQMIENIAVTENLLEFGACLITKIPPGKCVFPHSDNDYHATHFKDKYLLLLQSEPGQTFNYENETHTGKTGDLFHFNNNVTHWVNNYSDDDRISLIIAGRLE